MARRGLQGILNILKKNISNRHRISQDGNRYQIRQPNAIRVSYRRQFLEYKLLSDSDERPLTENKISIFAAFLFLRYTPPIILILNEFIQFEPFF